MRVQGPNGLTFDMPDEQAEALLRNDGFKVVEKPVKKAAVKAADGK